MGRGAAFAGIDDLAREQGVALAGIARRLGQRGKPLGQPRIEMGLRQVEQDPADAPRPARHAPVIAREQLAQRAHVKRMERRPGVVELGIRHGRR